MAEDAKEREIVSDQKTATAAAEDQAKIKEANVNRLIGLAQAAIASQNPLDLEAARMLLDGPHEDSGITVLQGFIQGAITEQQARLLLQLPAQQAEKDAAPAAAPVASATEPPPAETAKTDAPNL